MGFQQSKTKDSSPMKSDNPTLQDKTLKKQSLPQNVNFDVYSNKIKEVVEEEKTEKSQKKYQKAKAQESEDEEEPDGIVTCKIGRGIQIKKEETLKTSRPVTFVPEFTIYKNARVVCEEIKEHFSDQWKANSNKFMAQTTQQQVVHFLRKQEADNLLKMPLKNQDTIKFILNKYSYNFGRISDLSFLAEGGESVAFRINPFIPLEVIAKTTTNLGQFNDILLENHYLRLISHGRYVARVLEELIICSQEDEEILFIIAIIESAENDLAKLAEVWSDQTQAEEKLDFFSTEKLEMLCVRAMEAIDYFHSQNIYYGDMKPENLLIFRDYTVKLGDIGCCIKFDDASTDDSRVHLRGVTKAYSSPEIFRAYQEQSDLSKKTLFENDYVCLYKTFAAIQKNLKHLIPQDSKFNEMVQDLGNYKISLKDKIAKWTKNFYLNDQAITKLVTQLDLEDKIYALSQVFFGSIAQPLVEHYLILKQKLTPSRMKLEQFKVIEEDSELVQLEKETKGFEEIDIQKDLRMWKRALLAFLKSFSQYYEHLKPIFEEISNFDKLKVLLELQTQVYILSQNYQDFSYKFNETPEAEYEQYEEIVDKQKELAMKLKVFEAEDVELFLKINNQFIRYGNHRNSDIIMKFAKQMEFFIGVAKQLGMTDSYVYTTLAFSQVCQYKLGMLSERTVYYFRELVKLGSGNILYNLAMHETCGYAFAFLRYKGKAKEILDEFDKLSATVPFPVQYKKRFNMWQKDFCHIQCKEDALKHAQHIIAILKVTVGVDSLQGVGAYGEMAKVYLEQGEKEKYLDSTERAVFFSGDARSVLIYSEAYYKDLKAKNDVDKLKQLCDFIGNNIHLGLQQLLLFDLGSQQKLSQAKELEATELILSGKLLTFLDQEGSTVTWIRDIENEFKKSHQQ